MAKAAEAASKGPDGRVPKDFDLLRAAITQLVELAAKVGVRRSCLEDNDGSIQAGLSKLMKQHREPADVGASNNRFSRKLVTDPTADVSAAVLEAAAVAQARKSLTSLAAAARSSDKRDTLGVQGTGASWG